MVPKSVSQAPSFVSLVTVKVTALAANQNTVSSMATAPLAQATLGLLETLNVSLGLTTASPATHRHCGATSALLDLDQTAMGCV